MLAAGIAGLVAFNLLALTLTRDVASESTSARVPRHTPDLNPAPISVHTFADEKIATATTERDKAKIAAGVFAGFWMLQGRGRAELCEEAGVDLTPFRLRFEGQHAALHSKATMLLAEDGIDIEYLYSVQRDAIQSRLSYEMLYLDGAPTHLKDACERFLERADSNLAKLRFRQAEPGFAKRILGAPT
jgi:hypothetical protein